MEGVWQTSRLGFHAHSCAHQGLRHHLATVDAPGGEVQARCVEGTHFRGFFDDGFRHFCCVTLVGDVVGANSVDEVFKR